MQTVGITGGIGSGKSLICKIFNKLNIPVFNADIIAKDIINNNIQIKEQLINLFGEDIYLSNGSVHRKKLAGIIFNNKIALQKINNIVHPVVRLEFIKWTEKQNSPYVIQESAIIFENQMNSYFDKIITVSAPIELRIERVIKRDLNNREQIIERIDNQLSDEYKIAHSDYVIINDEKTMLLKQVLQIHKQLI